jgi:acetamidase/formamidase
MIRSSLFKRGTFMSQLMRGLMIAALFAYVGAVHAQPVPPKATPDHTLKSRPETIVWGYLAADIPPALTIRSGQTVRIDTVSHQGVVNMTDPVTFFSRAGIPREQVLQDAVDIYAKAPHPDGSGAHVLTGPIYVEGAEPGDMLEVRIHQLDHRTPYGVNNAGPRTGVLTDVLTGATPKIIKFDLARKVAQFSSDIEVPLSPFLGIMAVAPSRDRLMVSSRPPSRWGGNIDFNKLGPGATLYLPVFNEGAQFFTGDPHAVQGDGEVNGTAIEASLTATLQFVVHKGAGSAMRWPRAEDANNYYVMGLDLDLDVALQEAVRESIAFLKERYNLSDADAYSLSSVGIDFRVGEAVDSVLMVYGVIPKRLFKTNTPYWAR